MTVHTHKSTNVQQLFTLLLNQVSGIFKGHIEVHSEINLTPSDVDKINSQNRAQFFMSVQLNYDVVVSIYPL